MAGEHCLVVAPGPSAMSTPTWRYRAHWTIGCNRAVTFCEPDFAVCVETRKNICWRVIEAHQPLFTFSHISNGPARCLRIWSDLSLWLEHSPKKLWLGMSPFYGAAVAILLGFERIGLIGVDLTDAKYRDPVAQADWEDCWGKLMGIAEAHGKTLVNLNPKSRLAAVPAGAWKDMGKR